MEPVDSVARLSIDIAQLSLQDEVYQRVRSLGVEVAKALLESRVVPSMDVNGTHIQGGTSESILQKRDKILESLWKGLEKRKIAVPKRAGPSQFSPVVSLLNNYGIRLVDDECYQQMDEDETALVLRNRTFKVDRVFPQVVNGMLFASKDSAVFCDSVNIRLANNHVTWTHADGCGLGPMAKNAAEVASTVALQGMLYEFKKKITTRDIAKLQLASFRTAQDKLLEEKDIGSTAITIVTVVQKVLVCTSVGDVKVFVLRRTGDSSLCVDITAASRDEMRAAADAGGALGRVVHYENKEREDLRNLAVHQVTLQPGDVVVSCSDGVYDNLHPVHMGLMPRDFGIDSDVWRDDVECSTICRQAMHEALLHLAGDLTRSEEEIAHSILNFCYEVTLPTKLGMLNTQRKLPKDYRRYPGKPDHASCVVYKIR